MPVVLTSELVFPSVYQANSDGIVAIGGDLSPERLLLAYSKGIFPWYNEGTPILWWSPDPRCILPLDAVYTSRRLKRRMRQGIFHCTMNQAFGTVTQRCAQVMRPGQNGTWLLPDMQRAYLRLHQLGFAHSVECWQQGELVGGIYGVTIGKAFFGESMFHVVSDASKVALMHLVGQLQKHDFTLFDCQQDTPHMVRMGAIMVSRNEFMARLTTALPNGTRESAPMRRSNFAACAVSA